MNIQIHSLSGQTARKYVNELADLRIEIFKDFPYLYEGSLDYEKKYLETYFKSSTSKVFLALDGKKVIGASTCILASEEEEAIKAPLKKAEFNPEKVLYFGESVLLHSYRGQGIGKTFMEKRIAYAKELHVDFCAFLSVSRDSSHPKRPQIYRPLDGFWRAYNFSKRNGMNAYFGWKEIGESQESKKQMDYWIKELNHPL